MKIIRLIVGFAFLVFMTACSSPSLDLDDTTLQSMGNCLDTEWTLFPYTLDDYMIAVESIQRRAHQIAEVGWSPLGDIPSNGGAFVSGKFYRGIPYSSVKELDKFVGQDVSFYTFLSAVQNPKSVLYSENVGEEPYSGVNCATYYGTVCSMAINYVLGFNAPYESNMYPELPFIELVENQSPQSIRIGDILWMKGHVVLVEDIEYGDDYSINHVDILESSGSITRIIHYSFNDFCTRWKDSSWVLYRYLDFGRIIQQENIPFLRSCSSENCTIDFKNSICVSRGDRASYRFGEDVVINILDSPSPLDIDIYKDGRLYLNLRSVSDDITLTNLPIGKYVAIAEGGKTAFEVIQANVTIQHIGDMLKVSFSSLNGLPVAFVVCNNVGSRYICHSISEAEQKIGFVSISKDVSNVFIKVFFQGEYGRVTNDPLWLH